MPETVCAALLARELRGRRSLQLYMIRKARRRVELAKRKRDTAFIIPNYKGAWIARCLREQVEEAQARLAELEG